MQLLEALPRDVRVNLCGGNIRMPQKHLYHSQIGSMIQQMCCKRVPQDMGRQVLGNPGQRRVTLDQIPEGLSRHSFSTLRHEYGIG